MCHLYIFAVHDPIAEQFIASVVPHIAPYWKSVADYLECQPETICLLNYIFTEPTQRCMEMLNFWFDSDKSHTCRRLMFILKEIKGLNMKINEVEITALQEYVERHV